MKIRYAEYDEIDEITIDDKKYPCQADFGCEYLEESNNKRSCGYPIEPFQFSRMVNDDFGYLFDAKGIIWMYGQNNMDGDKMFYRSCFKDCATQILMKEEPDFDYKSLNKYVHCEFFSSELAAGFKAKFRDKTTEGN